MGFESLLVRQHTIEAAIQPILVDLLFAKLKQIAQRRAPIPVLGNVQLARRLAEAGRDQHRRHLREGDAFLADRQKLIADILKARAAPQRKRKIDIPELTRALDPNALQANRHRHVPAAVIEQPRFLRNANQMARQRPSLDAAALIKLAEMSDRLLDDASAEAHTAHQAPIPMDLSVLLACRAAQIHAPIESESLPSEKTLGRHYTPKSGLPRIPSP